MPPNHSNDYEVQKRSSQKRKVLPPSLHCSWSWDEHDISIHIDHCAHSGTEVRIPAAVQRAPFTWLVIFSLPEAEREVSRIHQSCKQWCWASGHASLPKKHTQDVEIGSDPADLCFHMEMKLRFHANRTRIHTQKLHCWKVAMMGTFRPILESPPPSPQTSTDFARDDGVRWSWWTRKKMDPKSLSPPCLLSNLSTFLPYSLTLNEPFSLASAGARPGPNAKAKPLQLIRYPRYLNKNGLVWCQN